MSVPALSDLTVLEKPRSFPFHCLLVEANTLGSRLEKKSLLKTIYLFRKLGTKL